MATRLDRGSDMTTLVARPAIPTEWTSLRSSTLPRDRTIWPEWEAPEELMSLPRELNLVPKLTDIVYWSLQRPSSSSSPAKTKENPQLNVQNGHRIRADDRTDASSTRSDTNSTKSSVLERAVPKLRGIKHDLILTAVSRITALKEKHDHDRVASSKTLKRVSPAAIDKPQTGECTSCFEDFPVRDLVNLPCTHNYCKPCLSTLVMTALQSEASFPPKCCLSPVPPATVVIPLDRKQQDLYKEKVAEYSIPAVNRRYCPNTKCLKWIPPNKLQRSLLSAQKCPFCQTKICAMCRGASHARNVDCPQDIGLEATISVAEAEGWRRCYSCRTMVERATGCRHITCKCGAEFCYVCGSRWRTCSCTEVDEANRQALLRRQRLEREAVNQAEADEVARAIAVVEALVRQEAEQRRQRQEEEERERQREEAELARLEQIRLEEEEARQREQEDAERQLRDILRLSILEEADTLRGSVKELIHAQHVAIDDRQGVEEQNIVAEFEKASDVLTKNSQMLEQNMEKNVAQRIQQLKSKQQLEAFELDQRHEEQEDDLFLEIQAHLKGKPNREAREQRLVEALKNEQSTERNNLLQVHDDQTKTLENVARMEVEGLKRSGDLRRKKARNDFDGAMDKLLLKASIERRWFDVVWERRIEMVEEHERMMMYAFESGREPQGLTEEQATTIMPLPAKMRGYLDITISMEQHQDPLDSIQHTPVELEAPMLPALRTQPVAFTFENKEATLIKNRSDTTIAGANLDLGKQTELCLPTLGTQGEKTSSESSYTTARTTYCHSTETDYSEFCNNPWAWAMSPTESSRPTSGISSLGGVQLARHLTPPSPLPDENQTHRQSPISTSAPMPHNGNHYLSMKNGECSRPIYDLPPMAFEHTRAPPTPPESPLMAMTSADQGLLPHSNVPYAGQSPRSDNGLKLRVPSRLSSGANSMDTTFTVGSTEQASTVPSSLSSSRPSPSLDSQTSPSPLSVGYMYTDSSLDLSKVKNKRPVEGLGLRRPAGGTFDADLPSAKGSCKEIVRKSRWPFRRKQYSEEEIRDRMKRSVGDAFA